MWPTTDDLIGQGIYAVMTICSTLMFYIAGHFTYHGNLYKAPLGGGLVLVTVLFVDLGFTLHYRVLDSWLGCDSPAAYAASISRVSASMVWQGYTFMIVALCFLAYIFTRVIAQVDSQYPKARLLAGSTLPWKLGTMGNGLMRIGFSMTAFTAVMPDEANNCALLGPLSSKHINHYDLCPEGLISNVHLAGIAGGIAVSTVGVILRLRFIFKIRRTPTFNRCARARRPRVVARV